MRTPASRGKPGPYLVRLEVDSARIPEPKRFPFTLPAISSLSVLPFHPKVTFFVGENGSGKSTLLEAIAVHLGLNPEGGSRNFNFSTRASHSSLDQAIRIARAPVKMHDAYFLRAESYFNLATEIERLDEEPSGGPRIIDSYGGRSLHEQSHGESFFALFRNRFRGDSLYLLDEPEAALSPTRQLQYLALMHDYLQRGCQFVIATHSPILMAYPEATIYHFSDQGITAVPYRETEHYQVTLGFLSNPKRSLDLLMRASTMETDEGA